MPTLFVNAAGAKAGGGLNDLANTLPLLGGALGAEGWRINTWVVAAGAEALRACGYDMGGVTTIRAEAPHRRADWEYRRFPRVVRRERPDVVFQFANLVFRRVAAPQMTVLRSPTFYNAQYAAGSRSGAYLKLRYALGKRIAARTVERAEEVFCISAAHRDDIIDTLGELGRKVRVSHLGFERPAGAEELLRLERAGQLARLSPHVRGKMTAGGVASRPLVLNVAHYYEHKNLGDLLRAARLVRADVPNVALVITAGMTTYDGPWTARTRSDARLARELEREGVLIDLGPVARSDVWPLMAAADVFAFPSSLESFGHPLLEAMSMRLPVVASDTRVHREIAGDAARYHRVGDPQGLAGRIGEALGSRPEGLVELGEARAREFSWRRHVDDLAGAVRRLCGREAGGEAAGRFAGYASQAGRP